jgi:hypothetical protein
MNRNSNPLHRELFSPNTGDTTRNLPTGIRPYGRSWQRPGVTPDHWPAGAGKLECPGGIPGWAKYGRRAAPRYTLARTSRLYRLQRTRRRRWQSGPPESAHRPGIPSPGRRKVIHDYPRHFPEFLPLASSRRRAGWLANGCGQPPRYGLAPGSRGRAAA